MNLYLIENTTAPWGDWGDILWCGVISYDDSMNQYLIDRIGPYTPPAFFSCGNLVVTEQVKNLLEKSDLKGIKFSKEVKKRKIVHLDWMTWDKTKHISHYLDDLGEPEDIIYDRENDKELLASMPNYWLADIPEKINLLLDKASASENPSEYIYIDNSPSVYSDFYQGIERLGCFISPKAKTWLDKHCPNCFKTYPISNK
ncbi:hypothetical protein [Pseudomonas weihenstephanensis]|uniref:Uncharacterized protein n=1 Tax=Pseudomonas weihenstephanensis TaxID=1608994 RepID=A0ABS1ZNT3_9PSED|nr:hypothetical protein [Pseudomonas weihenstephanensis]MBM1198147.1 hypothetical protein [Pseudomonas weihenstephanensis]